MKIDWKEERSEKISVTRHRGIRQQTEPVDGRPVIGSHRVYNAVVSKSRNKWSRRNAKKNGGARRPNYPLPASRRGGCRRFAWRGWFGGRGRGDGVEDPTRRRREVEIKFHVETV